MHHSASQSDFRLGLVTGIPSLHLIKNQEKLEDKFIEKKNKLNIQRVKMSSIIDDKNKTIYVIKRIRWRRK